MVDSTSNNREMTGSEAHFRAVIDAQGTVQIYNIACDKLFGNSSDEVVGAIAKLEMTMSCPLYGLQLIGAGFLVDDY